MKHFPKTITPPKSVFEARAERQRQMLFSIGIGISIRSLIIIVEFISVAYFGSSSLFMDALASLIDVASSICLLLFVKLAERPPDENHPFGHGRYEPLAGLQLGLLLVLAGIGMFVHQTLELRDYSNVGKLSGYIWIIPLCIVVALEICYAIAMRTAKKHHSPALAADALHYRIDSLTSLFATIALLIAAYLPQFSMMIDHLGAISIAMLMVGLGIVAVRNNVHQLLDRIPSPEFFEKVKNASKKTAGVLDTEKIRIQLYGPDAHVNVDVEVDPELTVAKAHQISQQVRVNIQKEWPAVRDVTVHVEPYYPNDH